MQAKPKVCSVNPQSLDWNTVLLDKDVVVLEFLEILHPDFESEFCQDALAVLHREEQPLDSPASPLRTAERPLHPRR